LAEVLATNPQPLLALLALAAQHQEQQQQEQLDSGGSQAGSCPPGSGSSTASVTALLSTLPQGAAAQLLQLLGAHSMTFQARAVCGSLL
jgi:hypothetical protein